MTSSFGPFAAFRPAGGEISIGGSRFVPDSFETRAGLQFRESPTLRVQFGDCTLDTDTRELSRDGKPVHLEPKVYRLLEILLAARPKALSKDELQDQLWPNTFVS